MTVQRAYATVPVVKYESYTTQNQTINDLNEVSGMVVAYPGPNRSIHVRYFYSEFSLMEIGDWAVWTYDTCHVKDKDLQNFPLVVKGDQAERYITIKE